MYCRYQHHAEELQRSAQGLEHEVLQRTAEAEEATRQAAAAEMQAKKVEYEGGDID
jgi:hypothetical protein